MKQGRVILADKHVNVLGAIRNLLETEAKTVLMVADETSLWAALENFKPDVLVADLSLPFAKGTNAAKAIKDRYPSVKVIILSPYDEESILDEMLAAGIEGVVFKRRAAIDLIPAMREILQGRIYVSQDIHGR
jgi:DNA-binding NarL/FixJ family response regulator